MARIFTDGAEFKDILFWDTTTNCSASGAQKRSGNYSYLLDDQFAGGSGFARKNFSATTEMFFRFGWYGSMNNQTLAAYAAYALIYSGTHVVARLCRNGTTGKLEYYNEAATLLATGNINVPTAAWMLMEIHMTVNTVSGVFQVKIDGVLDIDYSGNTDSGSRGTVDAIAHNAWSSGDAYIDDIAANDNTGPAPDNTWCGDGYLVLINPDGDGGTTQFTPSAAVAHYTLVDDIVGGGAPDGDSTYVESGNIGDKDLYTLENYDITNKYVSRVYVEARAKSTAAVGDTMKLVVLSNVTEVESSAQALAASYTRVVGTEYQTDPDTGTNWTQGGINALQAGVKVS